MRAFSRDGIRVLGSYTYEDIGAWVCSREPVSHSFSLPNDQKSTKNKSTVRDALNVILHVIVNFKKRIAQ
jgi:hypothetical protein